MATTLERHTQHAEPVPTAERITVALTRKAAEHLQQLRDWSGLSKTDLVNRALSVYRFVAEQEREGRQLAVYDPEKSEFQLVHIV
jgi:hypothetical protein